MLLPLDQIPEKGRDLGFDDVEPWAIAAVAASVEGDVSSLDGHLHIVKHGKVIRVTGQLHARFTRSCDSCLEAVPFELGGDLDLSYAPYDAEAPSSRELKADDLDIGFYTDGVLDLSAVLQEHFALLLPSRLTCDQEPSEKLRVCPGLPLGAGLVAPADAPGLRQSPPPSPTQDPRFAVLRSLKLDN